MIPARIAMVVVAVAAIFCLGTWLHQTRLFADARVIGVNARTPAQLDHAVALLHNSARNTPDTLPEVGEAFLLVRAHRGPAAEALMRSVLRREPRNVSAWALLSQALDGRDAAGAARARAEALRLSPPVKTAKSP
ncbi:MAG: hypothetical protein QOC95_487 [Thermoleophilaceae bacterium]|nr:hypothetical protein [Thermoleophilaceae bacterium]